MELQDLADLPPMVCSGLSDVIGSWKMIEMSLAADFRHLLLGGLEQILAVEEDLPAGWEAAG